MATMPPRSDDARRVTRAASTSTSSEDESEKDALGPSTSAPNKMTLERALKRMWTRADRGHVHGISGGAYTALGAVVMGGWFRDDVDAVLTSGAQLADGADVATTTMALILATTCAVSGVPLSKSRGWRKTELSLRSIAFQLVLTWEALRFGGVVDPAAPRTPILDSMALAYAPFLWQTITSAYVILATKDDKRAALAVWLGTLGFAAQILPAQRVLSQSGVSLLDAARPGLSTVWAHSTFGLVWLLNWSTFGASLRARDVTDDENYVKWFLLRPSVAWLALFVADVAARRPFVSLADYFTSLAGSVVVTASTG